jgi:hypothetical protein
VWKKIRDLTRVGGAGTTREWSSAQDPTSTIVVHQGRARSGEGHGRHPSARRTEPREPETRKTTAREERMEDAKRRWPGK